jgi:hypothetical protein
VPTENKVRLLVFFDKFVFLGEKKLKFCSFIADNIPTKLAQNTDTVYNSHEDEQGKLI